MLGQVQIYMGCKCVLLLLDAPTGGKSNISSKHPPPANAGGINYINKYYSSNLFGNKCDISK